MLKRFIDLYLYSSLHIGLGALALTFMSFIGFGIEPDYYYLCFVCCSTIFLYCLHRYIGIQKIIGLENRGRFDVINHYRNHILIYTLVSAVGSMCSCYHLESAVLKMLIVPSIISLLYALPILGRGKRLRDFGYIKIFLISIIWSWITVLIPLYSYSVQIDGFMIALLTLERFLFFMAITIPFDLRDRYIDERTDLKTLVHLMTSNQARSLCYNLLMLCSILLLYIYSLFSFNIYFLISYMATYIITAISIYITRNKRHDYYYTGLLDGMMLLPIIAYRLLWFLT